MKKKIKIKKGTKAGSPQTSLQTGVKSGAPVR